MEIKVFSIHYALLLAYKMGHWLSKGESSYSDHMLYDRLYGELYSGVDDMAEKWIEAFGEESIHAADVSKHVSEILSSFPKNPDPNTLIESLNNLQVEVLKVTKAFYMSLDEKDGLSLGMDDFLMSLCNDHEHRLYLLKQRNK